MEFPGGAWRLKAVDEVVFVEASCRCGFYFVDRGYIWFLPRGERAGERLVSKGKGLLRLWGDGKARI